MTGAAEGVDLLVIATPDAAIAEVAAAVGPVADTVVAHLAGSLGLDVLAPHARRAAIHPLVAAARPDDRRGPAAGRLVRGGRRPDGVAGGRRRSAGRPSTVADDDRAAYHAAACIASNHLVALLGQVERVAATAGVPLAAYLDLARAAVDDVAALGPGRRPHRPGGPGRLGDGRPPPRCPGARGAPRLPGHGRAGRPPGRAPLPGLAGPRRRRAERGAPCR